MSKCPVCNKYLEEFEPAERADNDFKFARCREHPDWHGRAPTVQGKKYRIQRASILFILFFLDNLDSTIASPVGELIEAPLSEITLAVVEAYRFRASRQYLELWCTHVIRNDLDHTLKFDETRGIARVKNVYTLDRVIVFSTSDVRVVKAYCFIYRLFNSDVHATRAMRVSKRT